MPSLKESFELVNRIGRLSLRYILVSLDIKIHFLLFKSSLVIINSKLRMQILE